MAYNSDSRSSPRDEDFGKAQSNSPRVIADIHSSCGSDASMHERRYGVGMKHVKRHQTPSDGAVGLGPSFNGRSLRKSFGTSARSRKAKKSAQDRPAGFGDKITSPLKESRRM